MESKGYLLKDCGKSELLIAIHKVHKGGLHFSINKSNTILQTTKTKSKDITLSSREFEVLLLMANDKNCSEIAEELGITKLTIGTHRQRLLIKSGSNTTTGLINWAHKQNLIQNL